MTTEPRTGTLNALVSVADAYMSLSHRSRVVTYLAATAVVGVCTAVDWALRDAVAESDLVMVLLVGVMLVAGVYGLGPSLWAAAVSVAAFDLLFVAPRFTFAVAETRYLITFAVMGATGFTLASTTARIRTEATRANDRAQLRRKIERDTARPRFVLTEVGVGYRFAELDE